MAYAQNKNGTITVYQSVPKSFEGSQKEYLGGFDQLTEAERKAEGLFDVVLPDGYNSEIHDLGDIYWDSANSQFTYPKTNKTWSQTLAELKTQKISNLKANAHRIFQEKYDWYYIRQLRDSSKAVPSEIDTAASNLAATVATKESEINAKTTKAAVVQYDITL